MLNKIKAIFKPKEELEVLRPVPYIEGSNLMAFASVIYHNDYINLCHDTCTVCYNKDGSGRDLEQRKKYIENKVRVGHESILEHSNVILKIEFELTPENRGDVYKEIALGLSFLNFTRHHLKEEETSTTLYVKGSIRALKEFIRHCPHYANLVYCGIRECLLELEPCVVIDLIEDDVLSLSRFVPNYASNIERFGNEVKLLHNGSTLDIIACDRQYLLNLLINEEKLSNDFALESVSVTVFVKRMPRVISQQLTRHRNAITQLSQRYADSSSEEFIVPSDMKEDQQLKGIVINNETVETTAIELGNMITHIYRDLLKDENKLRKEQARAYLPNNVNTQLYVTFSLKNLLHFLKLRTHQSAQMDIRVFADELYTVTKLIYGEGWVDYKWLEPYYKRVEEPEIDEKA